MGRRELVILTGKPGTTRTVARALGGRLEAGDVLALVGELGAGKTVFVKGLARGLGVPDGVEVTSPTFVLVSEYRGRLTLYHVDAYRLEGAADFEALGADEMLFGEGVCAIEWADRVRESLPPDRLEVTLQVEGLTRRRIVFAGVGRRWERRWDDLVRILDEAAERG